MNLNTNEDPAELISVVLCLRPLSQSPKGEPPAWWGRAVQSLLLETIRCMDADLAQRLHDDSCIHPYTVSNLLGAAHKTKLDLDRTCTLRLTSYDAALSQLLWQAVQPGALLAAEAKIELDYIPFIIEQVCIEPSLHDWADSLNYDRLAAQSLVGAETLPRHIAMQWASPVTFRSHEKHVPLPLPELVFGSLLERWNAQAPITFPPEARRFAAECMAVSRYHLRTRSLPLKGSAVRIGAVGEVSFVALNNDRYWLSVMHTLAAFSIFSGLGAGSSMGLGQCRSLNTIGRKSRNHHAKQVDRLLVDDGVIQG